MKNIIFSILLTITTANACIEPVVPVPPVGCSYSDAVLITDQDGYCYWVFVGC